MILIVCQAIVYGVAWIKIGQWFSGKLGEVNRVGNIDLGVVG